MDRRERARRQPRPLHALLAARVEEAADVAEVAEFRPVRRALGADRQRCADLRDHEVDPARGNLHPGVLADRVDRPQLEAESRHQQVVLEAGLAVHGDHVVLGEPAAEALRHQPDLGRADRLQAPQGDERDQRAGRRSDDVGEVRQAGGSRVLDSRIR
jgi:hypothetical protein